MRYIRAARMLGIFILIFPVSGCGLPRKQDAFFGQVTRLKTLNLASDTTWEGVVEIDVTVTIPSGVTLTIKPGTQIRFVPVQREIYGAGGGLIIQGTLIAKGTRNARIIFTSAAAKPRKGDWNDLFFIVSEGDNIIEHCVIQYANIGIHGHFCKLKVRHSRLNENWRGFLFQESELLIENNQLSDNNSGIKFRDSEVELTGNSVTNSFSGIDGFRSQVTARNNRVGNCYISSVKFRESELDYRGNTIENSRVGLQVKESSKVTISDSSFLNNFESGLLLKGSLVTLDHSVISGNGGDGVSVKNTGLKVNYCNIVDNDKYAIDNDGMTGIDARNNWWGTTDIILIAEQIYDFYDQESSGKVDFAFFLDEPIPRIK